MVFLFNASEASGLNPLAFILSPGSQNYLLERCCYHPHFTKKKESRAVGEQEKGTAT